MRDREVDIELQLVEQRKAWLVEAVETHRRITTTEAASQLDVSVDTIRRDLRQLHDQGLVRRVHGGAVPIARLPNSFAERSADQTQQAATLAAEVVKQFMPGQVIGLDGGTTCVDIATQIPSSLAVTIVTNNPAAAVALAGHPNATVILLGGNLDLTWMTTTGADTVDAWRHYRLDVGVLGLCGLNAEAGATTNSANEVATKRALIASSAKVVVPVHQDKVGVCAPYVIGELDDVDVVITTAMLHSELERALTEYGVHVVVCGSK